MGSKDSKKTIRDKALAQMRKTRAALDKDHPEMFKALRMLLANAHSDKQVKKEPEVQSSSNGQEESVAIDRQKNLEAVMKYAALNPGSEKLRDQLKEFIN